MKRARKLLDCWTTATRRPLCGRIESALLATDSTAQRSACARSLLLLIACVALTGGCESPPPQYGREDILFSPKYAPRSFAVAPAINLSGQRQPDALLQADLVFQELQQVRGITVVPVNRVAQAYAGLGIRQVESAQQAAEVCDAIGVDALIVPTITAFDPYDPPKMGASLQTFVRKQRTGSGIDVRQLNREPTGRVQSEPKNADFIQAAKLFDAAAGTTRVRVSEYARGRMDPTGALGEREFYMNMDRYASYVWHELIEETLHHFE